MKLKVFKLRLKWKSWREIREESTKWKEKELNRKGLAANMDGFLDRCGKEIWRLKKFQIQSLQIKI